MVLLVPAVVAEKRAEVRGEGLGGCERERVTALQPACDQWRRGNGRRSQVAVTHRMSLLAC